jgi:CheY-like chemotaxis protein
LTFPPEDLTVNGDLTRLSQVFSNLLNNAAKYTDKGGCIRLSAKMQREELLVRVRDNGIGIDPKILPNLFDPFRQAESTLERSQGGLGIGLTLVRSLVEMHGGKVEACSDGPGMGAEFIVRLPVLEGQATPIPPTRNDIELPENPPLSILVVDDNVDAAEMLSALLTLDGHVVATVHDGRSALKEAAQRPLDVILLDIGLPELNGYEVAKRLRSHDTTRRTKIIAMTGFGQERDRNRALGAGCDEHLPKPVAPATLRACLRKLSSPFEPPDP